MDIGCWEHNASVLIFELINEWKKHIVWNVNLGIWLEIQNNEKAESYIMNKSCANSAFNLCIDVRKKEFRGSLLYFCNSDII